MYIKESTFRLIIIFLVIIFAGALFFSVRFLKNKAAMATSPSAEVVSSGVVNFDQQTFDLVLKKIQ